MGRIRTAITSILRAFTSPFRKAGEYFLGEPDVTPLSETLGEAIGSRQGFMDLLAGMGEHLDALRRHLLRSVIVLLIATALSFLFAEDIMRLLAVPIRGAEDSAAASLLADPLGWWAAFTAHGAAGLADLQVIEPTESVGVFMRVSLLAGVALAMPWMILELYLFMAPGLMPRSRVYLLLGIPMASVLFLAGLAFCYFVMLPVAIPFLHDFMGFRTAWRPSAYFELVTALMFWVGITFQMPLIAYLLAATGLLRARQLASQWRIALVVIAIFSAAITPTTDPVNMAMVMAPMALLYLISIAAAAVAGAARGGA